MGWESGSGRLVPRAGTLRAPMDTLEGNKNMLIYLEY